jgi:hypothetical protein
MTAVLTMLTGGIQGVHQARRNQILTPGLRSTCTSFVFDIEGLVPYLVPPERDVNLVLPANEAVFSAMDPALCSLLSPEIT